MRVTNILKENNKGLMTIETETDRSFLFFKLNPLKRTFIANKEYPKGGGTWEYVTGGYVKKCLNLMFGWDWSFEIMDEKILFGEAIVKGKLTCNSNGKQIIKMQFGNKDIMYKRDVDKDGNRIPLSIGNDLKAAATDCLKKCAAEIGIAADIYNKEDFTPIIVVPDGGIETLHEELTTIFNDNKDLLPPNEVENLERIIQNKETTSYKKAIIFLKKIKT